MLRHAGKSSNSTGAIKTRMSNGRHNEVSLTSACVCSFGPATGVQHIIYSMTHLFPWDSAQLHEPQFSASTMWIFLGLVSWRSVNKNLVSWRRAIECAIHLIVGWELFSTTGANVCLMNLSFLTMRSTAVLKLPCDSNFRTEALFRTISGMSRP